MPEIVLCVCTCNRPALLERLLDVLARSQPGGLSPERLAVVVVDNRPGGAARAVCEARAPSLPMPLRYVEEPEPGISFARNRGLVEAMRLGAEAVAFVDDDDLPSPDWLAPLAETWRETGRDLVFGIWQHPEELSLPKLLSRVRFFEPIGLSKQNMFGLPAWAGTYNVLLSRRLIEHFMGQGFVFRPELALTGGSDTELFIRAHRAGFEHAVAAGSIVTRLWEPERMTLRGVMRRSFRLGSTRLLVAELHASPERVQEMKRLSARKLVALLAKAATCAHRPTKVAVLLVRAAGSAGELYASSGRRYGYYSGVTRPRQLPTLGRNSSR